MGKNKQVDEARVRGCPRDRVIGLCWTVLFALGRFEDLLDINFLNLDLLF